MQGTVYDLKKIPCGWRITFNNNKEKDSWIKISVELKIYFLCSLEIDTVMYFYCFNKIPTELAPNLPEQDWGRGKTGVRAWGTPQEL